MDTGPILLQKRVEIDLDDTVGSLYFNHLFPMGVDAILESVDLVAGGDAPRMVQDESAATYKGWCGSADSKIDWSKDVADVHNLIRGCDPQPGAWSEMIGERVAFFGSTIASRGDRASLPGTIVGLGEDGMTVACAEGAVKIRRARVGRGAKSLAVESGFGVGDRFS